MFLYSPLYVCTLPSDQIFENSEPGKLSTSLQVHYSFGMEANPAMPSTFKLLSIKRAGQRNIHMSCMGMAGYDVFQKINNYILLSAENFNF